MNSGSSDPAPTGAHSPSIQSHTHACMPARNLGFLPDLLSSPHNQSRALENGTEHQLSGHIFFDAHEWTVLFFVHNTDGPKRGSAEGGTYTLEGDGLVFTHFYNLSVGSEMEGLAEAALQMTSRPRGTGTEEPSTIDITGDVLTIYFPSGNSMIFRRLS